MTWSIVSVPVLSVQSTSIAPKFWIELSFLTMTFFFDIASAPLERQKETIIGSISGVRPTAMASANRKVSLPQLCLVNPLIKNTIGDITAMKQIISQVNLFTPLSNAVSGCWSERLLAIFPKYVCAPVVTTTAVAAPLSTLVPRKQRFVCSMDWTLVRESLASVFSTGNDSPVSVAWMMNKSFEVSSRTSPGIMSPAESFTTSPGTSSLSGISFGWPSRNTVAVTLIIALSLAAALSAFVS